MSLFYYFLFLLVLTLLAHPIGESIPKKIFHADRFPFRSYKWEKEGRIYNILKISVWKDKIPDMSKVMHDMTPKKIERISSQEASILLTETCVAETVHWTEIILASIYLILFPSSANTILWAVWTLLANLPFILVQRYNRPRLQKMHDLLANKGR